MVERVQVPAESVDRRAHPVDPLIPVEEALHVIAGLDQVIVGIGNLEPAALVEPNHVDLALDSEVEPEAHGPGRLKLLLERHAGADLVRRPVEGVVRREPGDLGIPWQLESPFQIGNGGNLVVVGTLSQTIQRISGVEFRTRGKMLEVRDRHDLPLGNPMDVGVGPDAVLGPFCGQGFAEFADGGVRCFHKGFRSRSCREPRTTPPEGAGVPRRSRGEAGR